MHVIASQCSHWCGNPLQVSENYQKTHWCGSTQRLPCVKGAGSRVSRKRETEGL